MNILFILVNPVDTLLGAGFTSLKLYSDVSAGGSFATLVATIPLVATQQSIQYVDVSGTASTWYKTTYFGTTPGETSKGTAFQASTQSSYATVLELRSQSQKQLNTEDINIQLALDAAKFAIDNYTNHPLGFVASTTATTKLYSGQGHSYLMIDECTSVTLVEVKSTPTAVSFDAWTVGDWIACSGDPEAPEFNDFPYDMVIVSGTGQLNFFNGLGTYRWPDQRQDRDLYNRLPNVRITATWGYANSVPPAVKLATIAQANRWLKRGEAAWADTLVSQDFGTAQFRKALDPDIQQMLTNARLCKPATGRR